MSNEKKTKKEPSDKQRQYVPYTQSYKLKMEEAKKPKEDKKG